MKNCSATRTSWFWLCKKSFQSTADSWVMILQLKYWIKTQIWIPSITARNSFINLSKVSECYSGDTAQHYWKVRSTNACNGIHYLFTTAFKILKIKRNMSVCGNKGTFWWGQRKLWNEEAVGMLTNYVISHCFCNRYWFSSIWRNIFGKSTNCIPFYTYKEKIQNKTLNSLAYV